MLGLIVIFLSVICIVIHIKNLMKKSDEREFGLLKHILGLIGCLIALAIGLASFYFALQQMQNWKLKGSSQPTSAATVKTPWKLQQDWAVRADVDRLYEISQAQILCALYRSAAFLRSRCGRNSARPWRLWVCWCFICCFFGRTNSKVYLDSIWRFRRLNQPAPPTEHWKQMKHLLLTTIAAVLLVGCGGGTNHS